MNEFSIAYFLAALCFFLYGLHMTEESLRLALGDQLRVQVEKITRRRISAFFFGVLATVVFQSSTAATVMLIGLASIGIVGVRQAVPVILGAGVGTTLLVLLLASFVHFDVRSVALGILVLGFLATFAFRTNRPRLYAQALLGFGFLFYGLSLLTSVNEPLGRSPLVHEIIQAIVNNPPAALFFAALFTALIQSSAAVLGILISFAASGMITAAESVPFVLGANLGSTVGPYIASLRAQTDGKRVAFIQAALRGIGVLCFAPFAADLGAAAAEWVSVPSYQIAAVHIVFNAALAVVFLPVTPWIAAAASKMIRQKENGVKFGSKYLDPAALDSPVLAFANTFREILRMAEIAQEMCAQVLVPFEEIGRETMERLEGLDDQVDHLEREIKFYLAKINQASLTEPQSRKEMELLTLTHDLESIGDVINKDLMELAEKKRRKNVKFSTEGWAEIKEFHRMVMENLNLAITALASGDRDLGGKVLRRKKRLAELEQELGQKHLLRLHQGLREAFDTSSIHLDLLSNLRRINSIVCKMAYPVVDRRGSGD